MENTFVDVSNNIVQNDQTNLNTNNKATSTAKNFASQFFAAFAINIVGFSINAMNTYYRNCLIGLSYLSSRIDITFFQNLQFYARLVGCIFFGILSHFIGNRMTILVAAIVSAINLIFMYLAETIIIMHLFSSVILGFIYMIPLTSGLIYVAEISQPKLRTTLTATVILFFQLGEVFEDELHNAIKPTKIPFIIIGILIAAFIAVICIPESPQWLADKGRIVKAELSLSWLRGWTAPHQVKSEFRSLTENDQNTFNSYNSFFTKKTFFLPFATMFYMFLLSTYNGKTLISYSEFILNLLNFSYSQNTYRVIIHIIYLSPLLGVIVCTLLIYVSGKKRLMLGSMIGVALFSLIISILFFLLNKDSKLTDRFQMPVAMMLIVIAFLLRMGFDTIMYMWNVELFPIRYRNISVGICIFWMNVMYVVSTYIMLPDLEILTLAHCSLAFFLVNLFGSITLYRILPNIDRKTLKEVNDYYASIKF